MNDATWVTTALALLALAGCVDGEVAGKEPTDQAEGLLALVGDEARALDGLGNNLAHPTWGAAGEPLVRRTTAAYADGRASPAGGDRPSARGLSNLVVAGPGGRRPPLKASDYLWAWGQFIDHDLDRVDAATPLESFPVRVPGGDPWFDPAGDGGRTIPLDRSAWVLDGAGVRQQVNGITAFIDASNVYGAELDRGLALRTLDGTGRLQLGPDGLLPRNLAGFPNAQPAGTAARDFFFAGDVRANEVASLISLHTLFVREHNRVATLIATLLPGLTGEDIYQAARRLVGAELQAITYNEFLPRLLGDHLPDYPGYRPEVVPGIANSFATAGFRLGHSLLPNQIARVDGSGQPIAAGPLALADGFFAPGEVEATGVEPILRGLTTQRAQPLDTHVVDGVRNFLFGPPGAGGMDLAALNIQRGRDHGLPGYAQARRDLGLAAVTSFAQITSDPDVADRLALAYGTVEEVDLWVGALAEDPVPGAAVGEVLAAILVDQFTRVRDGDRFWYQRLPPATVAYVESMTLARVIRANTPIGAELPDDVFAAPTACADGTRAADGLPVAVPDADAAGVRSTIEVSGDGVVATARVSVHVAHGYRGDLRVALVSPAGTEVVLHDRAGAGADDVILDGVDLAGVVGQAAAGRWTLVVTDAAAADVGTLLAWSLTLATDCGQQCADHRATAGVVDLAIPDADAAGVTSTVELAAPGDATEVALSLSIAHPFRGDLRVVLTAPDGTPFVIIDRTGGAADDVDLVSQRVAMASGHAVTGTWTLTVSDLAATDVGTLRSWSLTARACVVR